MKLSYILPTLFIATFLSLGVSAVADDDIFGALADIEEVKSTYISGKMGESMFPPLIYRSLPIGMDISGFHALYNYELMDPSSVKTGLSLLDEAKAKYGDRYEILMSSKHDGISYSVYSISDPDGKMRYMMIITRNSPEDMNIVVIEWK